MKTLGLDPGNGTIGWLVYNGETSRVIAHGEIDPASPNAAADLRNLIVSVDGGNIAIERPRIYSGRDKDGNIKHAAGNDVADTCEQTGFIIAKCGGGLSHSDLGHGLWHCRATQTYLLERRAVTRAFRLHFGEQLVGDPALWRALVAEHGGTSATQGPKKGKPGTKTRAAEPDREPGHLHGIADHSRAAFAVAWALVRTLEARQGKGSKS